MNFLRTAFSACLLLGLLGACDDDERDPPPYRSGVDSEASVAELDDEEKRTICQSFDSYVKVHVGFDQLAYAACAPEAILFNGSRDDCERELAECVNRFEGGVQLDARLTDTTRCIEDLDECPATVGQLEGCINVNLDFVTRILDTFTCAGAEDEEQRQAASDAMETVGSCVVANAECREFSEVVLY